MSRPFCRHPPIRASQEHLPLRELMNSAYLEFSEMRCCWYIINPLPLFKHWSLDGLEMILPVYLVKKSLAIIFVWYMIYIDRIWYTFITFSALKSVKNWERSHKIFLTLAQSRQCENLGLNTWPTPYDYIGSLVPK